MEITNANELYSIVRGSIINNPINEQMQKSKTAIINLGCAIEDNLSLIKESEEQIQLTKLLMNVNQQKRRREGIAFKHFQKAFENSIQDYDCSWLNRDKIQEFLSSIGMTFVSFTFEQTGTWAELVFVRPPKMIQALPVPPLLITMWYETKQQSGSSYNTLVFKKVYVRHVITSQNYIHPHINGENVCMGNYFDIMNNNKYALTIEGYQEQVVMLDNLLSTYNPDSPYRTIDEIICNMSKKLHFNEYVYPMSSDQQTMVGEFLQSTRGSLVKIHDIIGRKHFEAYFEMLKNIKIAYLLEDTICMVQSLASEDPRENFEFIDKLETDLDNLFKNKTSDLEGRLYLTSLNDYKSYDDDDDDDDRRSILYSDNFEDLRDQWVSDLKEFSETEFAQHGNITFEQIPDLDNYFPEIIDQPIFNSDSIPF